MKIIFYNYNNLIMKKEIIEDFDTIFWDWYTDPYLDWKMNWSWIWETDWSWYWYEDWYWFWELSPDWFLDWSWCWEWYLWFKVILY
jgi:hypothetical protein